MPTLIFRNYKEFKARKDKRVNGVSKHFASTNPFYVKDNYNNKGCWNCRKCKRCIDCVDSEFLIDSKNCFKSNYSSKLQYCRFVYSCHDCHNCQYIQDLSFIENLKNEEYQND